MAEFTNMYMNRLGHKEINYVYSGNYIGSWMQGGTPDWVKGYVPVAAAGYERDYANGLLVQAGGDSMMGTVGAYPGGGVMGLGSSCPDGNDDSCAAARYHMDDAAEDAKMINHPPGKSLYIEMRHTDEQAFDKWSRPTALGLHSSADPRALRPQLHRRPPVQLDPEEWEKGGNTPPRPSCRGRGGRSRRRRAIRLLERRRRDRRSTSAGDRGRPREPPFLRLRPASRELLKNPGLRLQQPTRSSSVRLMTSFCRFCATRRSTR
jgi:hypothetical protein